MSRHPFELHDDDPSRFSGSGRRFSNGGRRRGFTLIELMIVVAIISILAAIAIPNFLHFQCKSKQSEMKAGLGALFVSEKAFLGEHNTYGTDLVRVGWEPEGSPLYVYGFYTANAYPTTLGDVPGWTPAESSTDNAGVVGNPPRYVTTKMVTLGGATLTQADLPINFCTGQSFLIGAVADINPDPGTLQLDTWTIDDHRQFQNISNDCTH